MKILVLTSKYPSPDTPAEFTSVVHYFAKEWRSQGHVVKVIHSQSSFPSILHLVPSRIRRYFESKLGFPFPTRAMMTERRYDLDGVRIHRLLIFKLHPFTNYRKRHIDKLTSKAIKSNLDDEFEPHCVVAHWQYPQLQLLSTMKTVYRCPTALVLHSADWIKHRDRKILTSLLPNVDVLGFRSAAAQRQFQKQVALEHPTFICHSGIPVNSLVPLGSRDFPDVIRYFLFAGVLIRRKHVDSIVRMFAAIYKYEESAVLEVIGDGPEMYSLKDLAVKEEIASRVLFAGRKIRQDVMKSMQRAECFVMVSSREAYGMVYLEALAAGCIVVASRNEGAEGIIVDGENGFLCNAGNTDELVQIITKINLLSREEKKRVSNNAILTARRFTNEEVAIRYLQQVCAPAELPISKL